MGPTRIILSCSFLALSGALAAAQEPLSFWPGLDLTNELPFDEAAKVKVTRLNKTPAGAHDGRLVVVYGEANNPELVWDPKSLEHHPRDIFARISDDAGTSWTAPVNLSQTANLWSAQTDWNGDGTPESFWGDSLKPNVFASGDVVVVSWVDRYCPEATVPFGTSAASAVQGTVAYPDAAVYPNERVVPYGGVYLAISTDGGTTWSYGGDNPPLQLTYGRRDALQDVHRGSGKRWIVTWQEDPEGLQPGEADGPGDGASGAKTSVGTDIWYTWTNDVALSPLKLRDQRAPLSDQSLYDLTETNGFPAVGPAGSVSKHGASRANAFLLNDKGVFKALVAYEETKGIPDFVEGKTVQYHAFPFDAPVLNGRPKATYGAGGTTLTPLEENSRRVRLVPQSPDGVNPALAIFWRQGTDSEGAPADIVLKVSQSVAEADVLAAQALNLSTNTPAATPADMLLGTTVDPLEDARAHRALLRGDMLVVGYLYTWNGPLARFTDMANYDFWIRRSLDGGVTWLAPENLSNLPTTKINVREPRLVGPPKTGLEDADAFLVAFSTETNVYEGLALPEDLDIFFTRTFDQGATFDPLVPLAATTHAESELQIQANDDLSEVYAVWMDTHADGVDARYAKGAPRDPLYVSVVGSPVPIGGTVNLTLHAPGYAGDPYQAAISTGFSPGIPTIFGTLPLKLGELLVYSLDPTAPQFVGFSGLIDPTGQAAADIHVPLDATLQGWWLYTAFVTFPGAAPWGISAPALIEIE